MRPVHIKPVYVTRKDGTSRAFNSLREALEWMNKSWARKRKSEKVYVSVPKAVKDELRRLKKKFGVSMSAQVGARFNRDWSER